MSVADRPPFLDYSALDAAQRTAFDEIAAGPRGVVPGPLRVWVINPQLSDRAQALGEYCRYGTSLPPRLSELAIIVTGAFWQAGFEWHTHAPIAQRAGVSASVIEDIRLGRPPAFAVEDEAAVYDFLRALLRDRKVPDPDYRRVIDCVGLRGAVDLVGIAGYYSLICLTINAFEVPVPDGAVEPFADPGAATERN